MARRLEFDHVTKVRALERQRFRCALCGTRIHELGESGRSRHKYGERADAHHVQHAGKGGTAHVSNCVILCEACHYDVHEGGNYRYGTVVGRPSDYPHYRG